MASMRCLRPTGPQPFEECQFDQYSHLLEYVKKEGLAYLNSNPGDCSRAKNRRLHADLNHIIRGELLPIEHLESVRDQIDYRMTHVVRLATAYKNELGVSFPDCHQVSTSAMRWTESASRLVWEHRLFDREYIRGFEYVKGIHYLAACIQQAGWTMEEAAEKLAGLVRFKETRSIYAVVRDDTRANNRSFVRQVDQAEGIIEIEGPSNSQGVVKARE